MGRYFNPSQMSLATGVFLHAEKLAARYFGLTGDELNSHRYDIKTLAYLNKHEVSEGAFAHLCKYAYGKEQDDERQSGIHFYRVCLQDDHILDAVERANSFIRLEPLMLYIAAHEIIHIIRFDRGEIDFDASREEKEKEEEKVNLITRSMLASVKQPDVKMVVECFSSRYKIGDLFV
jgi:hypothetical protein